MTMNTRPIVSPQEWEAARERLLVKEKALTRARDALAAERRRMPWLAVDADYELPRRDSAGAPGGLGGLAQGLSADPALQVVELARRVCC